MPGKRQKEPVIHEMRAALEAFHDLVDGYREHLEAERGGAVARAAPDAHLVRALDRQIAQARRIDAVLDEQLWPELIALANGSASLAHTRSGDFF
jgi:hypothetical protein